MRLNSLGRLLWLLCFALLRVGEQEAQFVLAARAGGEACSVWFGLMLGWGGMV